VVELERTQESLREREDVLQRQQAELQALFDLMPAMVWFKDTGSELRKPLKNPPGRWKGDQCLKFIRRKRPSITRMIWKLSILECQN
jgi:hypothetical protein